MNLLLFNKFRYCDEENKNFSEESIWISSRYCNDLEILTKDENYKKSKQINCKTLKKRSLANSLKVRNVKIGKLINTHI